MPSPCPDPNCTGTLHSRGRDRPPKCSVCGHTDRPPGRPRIDPDSNQTDRDTYQRRKKGADRQVTYALFEQSRLPPGLIGTIHRLAFVGTVVGRSRKSVERDRPGLKAVPWGSLRAREKRWVEAAIETQKATNKQEEIFHGSV
jgi:hypothetical protein